MTVAASYRVYGYLCLRTAVLRPMELECDRIQRALGVTYVDLLSICLSLNLSGLDALRFNAPRAPAEDGGGS